MYYPTPQCANCVHYRSSGLPAAFCKIDAPASRRAVDAADGESVTCDAQEPP